MYVTPLDNAVRGSDMYVHVEKGINMYVHVYTILKKYKRVCTLYVHGMYNERYKHVRTSFRRACTCLYIYVHVFNHINVYIQCTNLVVKGLCT